MSLVTTITGLPFVGKTTLFDLLTGQHVATGTFAGAEAGKVVGPLELPQPDSTLKFAVVHLEEKRAAGQYTYDELKDRIREQLSTEAAERVYIDSLRTRTYVDIRLTP